MATYEPQDVDAAFELAQTWYFENIYNKDASRNLLFTVPKIRAILEMTEEETDLAFRVALILLLRRAVDSRYGKRVEIVELALGRLLAGCAREDMFLLDHLLTTADQRRIPERMQIIISAALYRLERRESGNVEGYCLTKNEDRRITRRRHRSLVAVLRECGLDDILRVRVSAGVSASASPQAA